MKIEFNWPKAVKNVTMSEWAKSGSVRPVPLDTRY